MNLPIREILRFLIEHKIIKSWTKVSDRQYVIEFY